MDPGEEVGVNRSREYVSEGVLVAAAAGGSGQPEVAGGERLWLYSFDGDLPNGSILR